MTAENKDTFASHGKSYQEKVAQALLSDHMFAEQMSDILQPKYFELGYLQEIVKGLYDYKKRYKTYPSVDALGVFITKEGDVDSNIGVQVKEYLKRSCETPLNGDKGYIEDSSLEFCRKQSLKDGILKAIDMMESGNYDSVQGVIREALNKGGSRDLGHDYKSGRSQRSQMSLRKPIPTGWPLLDEEFNGGWERKTLVTFIAPTGAGKSMFLVNCGAAAIAQGLNVLYITCEMAEFKIGLRFDSYYSGVEINNVPSKQDIVEKAIEEKAKGNLKIKEWPTKTATVQTIRAYIQRLAAVENFVPDMVIVDYADLLRGSKSYGDKRFELEGVYEELRSLAQEINVVMVTADQTNRSGLDMEIVSIGQIGESYAKATVCDVIVTISRRREDKVTNSGRLFVAKSRLGRDGIVFPFILNSATVKVSLLKSHEDPVAIFVENEENKKRLMSDKFNKFLKGKPSGSEG